MLDGNDKNTFHAVRLLHDIAKETNKPICFWIGAGISAWCNYPLWSILADQFHREYLKYEMNYDKEKGIILLKDQQYPSFFQLCRNLNNKRYFTLITKCFKPKCITPIYRRFLNSINKIDPLFIFTTNVDECIEHNINKLSTIQRIDIERCIQSIQDKVSFIFKAHGSVSDVRSTIFCEDDYESLVRDHKFLQLMRFIFNYITIVFIGYGFRDEYVIKLLIQNNDVKNLFGDGPHFLVSPDEKINIPDSIKIIKYNPQLYKDHRAPLQIIDEIKITREVKDTTDNNIKKEEEIKSCHLISDIYPPGTWTSSHTLELKKKNGTREKLIVGSGFKETELPFTISTAMHDIIVGIICFDKIYAPLSALTRLHVLLGSDIFWELVKSDCLEFIEWKKQLGIIYPDYNIDLGGELSSLTVLKGENEEEYTLQEKIKKHLRANPGYEKKVDKLFQILENKIFVIDESIEQSIPEIVRGMLLRDSIRKMIGMSGGTPVNSIPNWIQFPILRLSSVVKIGVACNILGIASTKLEYGTEYLAGVAFDAAFGEYTANEVSSFILTGRFDTNIGSLLHSKPDLIFNILKFRESQSGIRFRNEIFNQIKLNYGSEFISSINAGLKSAIHPATLQNAHDQFTGLLFSNKKELKYTRAVWNNLNYAKNAINLWKKHSTKLLETYCKNNNIGIYDPCPCNSGDRLKFCCYEALRR